MQEPTVALGISEYTDAKTEKQGIRIAVTNKGTEPINSLKVEFAFEFDTPLEMPTGEGGPKIIETGRSFSLGTSIDDPGGPLEPEATRDYLLAPDWISELRKLVKTVAKDKECVKLTMGTHEEYAVTAEWWIDFLNRRFGEEKPKRRFDLPQERIEFVGNMIGKLMHLNKPFKVHPPKEVTNDPSVLRSDDIVDRLCDSKWWLRLGDGSEELLSTPELLVLVRNYGQVMLAMQEAEEKGQLYGNHSVSVEFSVDELMTPEAMQVLLSKLVFEGIGE